MSYFEACRTHRDHYPDCLVCEINRLQEKLLTRPTGQGKNFKHNQRKKYRAKYRKKYQDMVLEAHAIFSELQALGYMDSVNTARISAWLNLFESKFGD